MNISFARSGGISKHECVPPLLRDEIFLKENEYYEIYIIFLYKNLKITSKNDKKMTKNGRYFVIS